MQEKNLIIDKDLGIERNVKMKNWLLKEKVR